MLARGKIPRSPGAVRRTVNGDRAVVAGSRGDESSFSGEFTAIKIFEIFYKKLLTICELCSIISQSVATDELKNGMEKSRSWPSAHDWKSCIPQKGIEGSNPSFSAITKTLRYSKGFRFFYCSFSPLLGTRRKHHKKKQIVYLVFSNRLLPIVYAVWYYLI